MEALKSIPQIFFDFFARITPGLYFLVIIEKIWPNTWSQILSSVSAGQVKEGNVSSIIIIATIPASWLLGQLLSPIGKLVGEVEVPLKKLIEKLLDILCKGMITCAKVLPSKGKKDKNGDDSGKGEGEGKNRDEDDSASKNSLTSFIEKRNKKLRSATELLGNDTIWEGYDWLRMHKPEAGAFTVRIRAEYTMFNSMAAASALGFLFAILSGKSWCIILLMFGLFLF